MIIIVIKPWQARLIMGLAFALFLAGGYHLSETATVTTISGPPPLDEPIFELPGAGNQASLTVNVDWGSEQISGMLDIFDRYGVKVTFFLTGKWAEQNQALAKRMLEQGHEIANHGRSHAHPKQLGDQALAEHISGNEALLTRVVGSVSKLYAPPYGEWDRHIVQKAAQLGHRTVLWTLDTIDWQDPAPSIIVQRIVPKAKSGSIVLMHPKPNTVAALPAMIEGLQAKGLKLVTVSTMLQTAATPTSSSQ